MAHFKDPYQPTSIYRNAQVGETLAQLQLLSVRPLPRRDISDDGIAVFSCGDSASGEHKEHRDQCLPVWEFPHNMVGLV